MKGLRLAGFCTAMLVTGALLGSLVVNRTVTSRPNTVSAATPPVWTGARGYYLTKTAVLPTGAINACSSGYHMASLYEIYNVSTLQYNTTLGLTSDDSGSGPPTVALGGQPATGWIRTGRFAVNSSMQSSGAANCANWTTTSPDNYGSSVRLNDQWTTGFPNGQLNTNPWMSEIINNSLPPACNNTRHVWCVQN
jgi:hypothetical protein